MNAPKNNEKPTPEIKPIATHTAGPWRWKMDPGVLYTLPDPEKPIEVTHWGFHAAFDPLVALGHGTGFYVERAKLSGTLDFGKESVAASKRTPLWRADATQVLAAFCADCAERAVNYLSARSIEPTAQTESLIRLARDFATGAKTGEQMQNALIGVTLAEWERDRVAAVEAELAAFHAASIYSGSLSACCALYGAAAAISAAADIDPRASASAAFSGEQLWQCYDLHDRLMALAPAGYKEPTDA